MSEPAAFDRRLVSGLALGGLLAAGILGPKALPWGLGIAFAALGWAAFRTWDRRRHGAKVLRGLVRRWLELPGAEPLPGDREGTSVEVHDGAVPLVVRLGRERGELRAAVSVRIAEAPAAFRVWPRSAPRPSLDPEGLPVGGPPVEDAPRLAQRLGGSLRAEASDERRVLETIAGDDLLAALLVVSREAEGSFGGLTFDGQRLTVHVRGPAAADPDRATRLARVLWRPFLGPAGDDEPPLASPLGGGY